MRDTDRQSRLPLLVSNRGQKKHLQCAHCCHYPLVLNGACSASIFSYSRHRQVCFRSPLVHNHGTRQIYERWSRRRRARQGSPPPCWRMPSGEIPQSRSASGEKPIATPGHIICHLCFYQQVPEKMNCSYGVQHPGWWKHPSWGIRNLYGGPLGHGDLQIRPAGRESSCRGTASPRFSQLPLPCAHSPSSRRTRNSAQKKGPTTGEDLSLHPARSLPGVRSNPSLTLLPIL